MSQALHKLIKRDHIVTSSGGRTFPRYSYVYVTKCNILLSSYSPLVLNCAAEKCVYARAWAVCFRLRCNLDCAIIANPVLYMHEHTPVCIHVETLESCEPDPANGYLRVINRNEDDARKIPDKDLSAIEKHGT